MKPDLGTDFAYAQVLSKCAGIYPIECFDNKWSHTNGLVDVQYGVTTNDFLMRQ